jgi:hypothetical protein
MKNKRIRKLRAEKIIIYPDYIQSGAALHDIIGKYPNRYISIDKKGIQNILGKEYKNNLGTEKLLEKVRYKINTDDEYKEYRGIKIDYNPFYERLESIRKQEYI